MIEEKGIVYPKWEKISYLNENGQREVNWRERYVWSFTRHAEIPKIESCLVNNEILRHLSECQFNKTRINTEKFAYFTNPLKLMP